MLYLEDPDGALWLETARALGGQRALDIVLCLYPESEPQDFTPPFMPAAGETLERVTSYGGGAVAPCSERLPIANQLLDKLTEHVGEFEDWGDNLTLYTPEGDGWVATYIAHEGMILVRDASLSGLLAESGLQFATDPPDWW